MNRPIASASNCMCSNILVLTLLGAAFAAPSAGAAPCDLSDFENQFQSLVGDVQPGVVSVIAYSETDARRTDGNALESVVESVGSGVVIDEFGSVLTTHSIVGESRSLYVQTQDGTQYPAVFLGSDPRTDLALLRVTETALKPVRLGDSSALEEGSWLITVGQPHGKYPDRSLGSFQSLARAGEAYTTHLLQMTAPVFPGQSGGAVVNMRGEVVGLLLGEMTMPVTDGRAPSSSRSSAAIPIDEARRIAVMLAESGHASPGYLGVRVRMPTKELKELLNFDKGVLIEELVQGSPAQRAALEAGDIILAVDGATVFEPTELMRVVSGKRPGDHCDVLLLRGDVKLTRTVTLAPSPQAQVAVRNPSASTDTEMSQSEVEARIQLLEGELARLRGQRDRP